MTIKDIIKHPIRWLFNLESDSKQMYMPLNASEREKFQALVNENASLKAQIGSIFAEKRQENEIDKEKDLEQEVIKDLNEQVKNINKERFGDTIDLIRFFGDLNNNRKLRNEFEITDKDDQVVFGKLGSIQVSNKNGNLIITDQYGTPMSSGARLSDIIYKPETLINQIRRKRILLPRDKSFNPAINFEDIEIPDVVLDSENKEVLLTNEFRGKAVDLIVKREKEIREKNMMIEKLENAQISQRKEINDLKRALAVHKNLQNTTESEFSQANNTQMQLIAKLGEMQRKISNLSELKAMHETQINSYQEVVSKLLTKMEQGGDKSAFEKIKEEVYGDMERAKSLLPETIIEQIHPKETPVQIPNPGQPMGNRRDIEPGEN